MSPRKFVKKLKSWIQWYEGNEKIRRGIIYPKFPLHVSDGLFAVITPIFTLRYLKLNIEAFCCLFVAEHVVQLVTHVECVRWLNALGFKDLQRRSVLILLASAGLLLTIPFFPEPWILANPWPIFLIYAAARLLFALGLNAFDTNVSAAVHNAAFFPPAEAVTASEFLYATQFLGFLAGSMLARLAFAVASIQWSLLVPALLVADMHLAVEAIADGTFPPDPATPAPATPRPAAPRGEAAAGPPLPGQRPIWDNPIWAHPESRWLLAQFLVALLLFNALHISFPFLLPLLGMRLGFDDEDVALLVALPPAAGLLLFWLGSAFADENYVVRGAVAGAGLAAGYWCAAAATTFFDLFVAAFVFAVAACYSCNLVAQR